MSDPKSDIKYIQNKSIADIKKDIDSFESDSVELKHKSIPNIENMLSKLILGHLRIIYKLSPEALVRGRPNKDNEVFTNKTDLWYPDWEKIPKEKHKFGRCNDKGEYVFYASTETDTTICELQLTEGDYFTLADFIPRKPKLDAILQVIGIKELSKTREEYEKVFHEHYYKIKKDSPEDYEKNILIDDFLGRQFTQIVSEEEDWKYKITIAITHILLSNPETDGLIYPSIAANAKGVNFALKPKIVDDNLRIVRAGMYQVLSESKFQNPIVRLIMVPKNKETKELIDISWKIPDSNSYQDFEVQCN